MSEEPKLRPFSAMEAAARQTILMVGLGFVGMIAGALLTSSLVARLNDRIDIADESLFQGLIGLVLPNLWAVVVMPALGWLTLRFLDLRPTTFAVVTCGTGFAFHSALAIVTNGFEALTADGLGLAVQVAFFFAGVLLTYFAATRGQAYAKAEAARAAQRAQGAKAQYEQFAEQAKALAERREALPIAPAPADPTASSGPSAAVAPDPTASSGPSAAVAPEPIASSGPSAAVAPDPTASSGPAVAAAPADSTVSSGPSVGAAADPIPDPGGARGEPEPTPGRGADGSGCSRE